MKKLITNSRWLRIYDQFIAESKTDENGYTEAIGFNFSFSPKTDNMMSSYSGIFDIKKAAKMFFWYKKADANDASIIKYFPEYGACIDETHKHFNSNYGVYAYKNRGLKFCVKELTKNNKSRRACFCINNNDVAINDSEIDKLCTNTLQFFIRDMTLQMVVQMRSSNFITLLPYDAFMFSVFYYEVYNALKTEYPQLLIGNINMQIASLHIYADNMFDMLAVSQDNFYNRYDSLLNFDNGHLSDTIIILNKYLNN